MKDKMPVNLNTMLGTGDDFEAKGKAYALCPMLMAHIPTFMKDNLSIGSQLFNIANEDSKEKVNKWLGEEVIVVIDGKEIKARYCFDAKGEPMSLDKAIADGWDIIDLRNFFKKLCDLSG